SRQIIRLMPTPREKRLRKCIYCPPRRMGEKPPPLGEDFSKIAVLCNTIARLRTLLGKNFSQAVKRISKSLPGILGKSSMGLRIFCAK
ncbi:MAG: hypothetical protein ACP5VS_17830, partial [Desulfomonilaceae bacterium]